MGVRFIPVRAPTLGVVYLLFSLSVSFLAVVCYPLLFVSISIRSERWEYVRCPTYNPSNWVLRMGYCRRDGSLMLFLTEQHSDVSLNRTWPVCLSILLSLSLLVFTNYRFLFIATRMSYLEIQLITLFVPWLKNQVLIEWISQWTWSWWWSLSIVKRHGYTDITYTELVSLNNSVLRTHMQYYSVCEENSSGLLYDIIIISVVAWSYDYPLIQGVIWKLC